MDIVGLVIQLIGGVAGGKGVASISKKLSSGPVLDIILGLVGGFAGGQLAGLIPGLEGSGVDIVNVLGNLIGGGIGGGALTAIGGLITQSIKK
jgi:uncharacterized membrane protein YeaQ/YmgE (transglycosylase-associated protein family)